MQPCRPMRMWSAPLAFENSRSECVIFRTSAWSQDDGERDPQGGHRSCAPKKTDLAAGVLERSGGRFAMKTVASTLGCRPIQSDRTARQGDPSSRPLSESRGCRPPTSHPGHHRRATYLRLSPGLGSLEPPSTQRWQAHGQHEAGAPDHAEPRTDTRTPYRPSS